MRQHVTVKSKIHDGRQSLKSEVCRDIHLKNPMSSTASTLFRSHNHKNLLTYKISDFGENGKKMAIKQNTFVDLGVRKNIILYFCSPKLPLFFHTWIDQCILPYVYNKKYFLLNWDFCMFIFLVYGSFVFDCNTSKNI